jgi:hypothetical protein
VRVGSLVRVFAGQVQFRHDPATTWLSRRMYLSVSKLNLLVLVLYMTRPRGNSSHSDSARTLPPSRHFSHTVDVAPRMGQVISICLGLSKGHAVDDQFATDQPENADVCYVLRRVALRFRRHCSLP